MHRAQRTADDIRDSHPHWCSFPRGLHLRLRWQHISRLQFKARGPNFHAELIPVHSPLLRESYLVSYPPLTYMLKFSGFAHLTSCHERNPCKDARGKAINTPNKTTIDTQQVFIKLLMEHRTQALNASRAQSTLIHRHALQSKTYARHISKWRWHENT